jgi:hypothetical protein
VVFCHVSRWGGCEPDTVRLSRAGESTGWEWDICRVAGDGEVFLSFYLYTAGEGHGAGEEPEVEVEKMHPTWRCCSLFLFLFLFLLRQLPRGGGLNDFAVSSPY